MLELSDAPGNPTPGEGKLVRVNPSDGVEEILGELVVPTAMTIGPDGAISISNFVLRRRSGPDSSIGN